MKWISNFIERIRKRKLFIFFTWFTRIMLALAFLPSGYKKLMGDRFTLLGIDTSVGFFFEGLFRAGYYWNFLGLIQLLAAFFLIIPRTSYFGAILYLPIIININIIVFAMSFKGTPVITSLLFLGNIYLLIWDFNKTKEITKIIFRKN